MLDLNTKLEDECLFGVGGSIGYIEKKLDFMQKNGIVTVGDFIECDIDNLSINKLQKNYYRGMKEVLKNKYLEVPMVTDVLLDKQYNLGSGRDNHRIIRKKYISLNETLSKLSLAGTSGGMNTCVSKALSNFYGDENFTEFKIIDLLKDIIKHDELEDQTDSKTSYIKLCNFYVDYYDNKQKSNNNNIDDLDSLKNEILSLVEQRDELDRKISMLQEKINILENNGKENAK